MRKKTRQTVKSRGVAGGKFQRKVPERGLWTFGSKGAFCQKKRVLQKNHIPPFWGGEAVSLQ